MTDSWPIDGEELKSLDLKAFNGGQDPYPESDDRLSRTFAKHIEYYRNTITDVVGATNGRVLDLLCGAGRWSAFLAEQNEYVLGIDRLQGCVNIAEGVCRRFGLSNAEFVAGEASYIEKLPKNSFDTVWMFSALQYVNRGYILSEIFRILKPGGKLFVGNYNSTGLMLRHVLNGVKTGEINAGASQWALNALAKGEQGDGNPNYTTLDGADEMCRRHGFALIKIFSDRLSYPKPPNKTPHVAKKINTNLEVIEELLNDYDMMVSFVASKMNKCEYQISSFTRLKEKIKKIVIKLHEMAFRSE